VKGSDLSTPGPFFPGVSTVTITRPDATTFTAKFYYPAKSAGNDTPFDASGGAYPMIAFGHGFFQQPFRYFGTLQHLSTHGYLVIATESETGLLPNHAAMASDMSLTLTYLENRGGSPADPLFGAVDFGNAGMSGHSMGAGVSLLAAQQDTRVRAVADLAAAITNPSPIPQLPSLNIPIALLHGDEDGIVPIGAGSIPLYNAATAPKLQPTIVGGYHVGFQDLPFPLFPDSGSLPLADQLKITRGYLTSFFDLYLKGDQSQWRNIWGPEAFAKPGLPTAADPGVTLTALATTDGASVGQSVLFQLTLTNTGTFANAFDLFVEDQTWNAVLGELTTPLLSPGETFSLSVTVDVPGGAAIGDSDTLLLSARSQADLGTRGYIVLTAVAVPEPATLVLALWGAIGSVVYLVRLNVDALRKSC
jgi:predicted dienelactone hydrolase